MNDSGLNRSDSTVLIEYAAAVAAAVVVVAAVVVAAPVVVAAAVVVQGSADQSMDEQTMNKEIITNQ